MLPLGPWPLPFPLLPCPPSPPLLAKDKPPPAKTSPLKAARTAPLPPHPLPSPSPGPAGSFADGQRTPPPGPAAGGPALAKVAPQMCFSCFFCDFVCPICGVVYSFAGTKVEKLRTFNRKKCTPQNCTPHFGHKKTHLSRDKYPRARVLRRPDPSFMLACPPVYGCRVGQVGSGGLLLASRAGETL